MNSNTSPIKERKYVFSRIDITEKISIVLASINLESKKTYAPSLIPHPFKVIGTEITIVATQTEKNK